MGSISIPYERVRRTIDTTRKRQLKDLALTRSALANIPPEVFNMEYLESLDLTGNYIIELPEEIERLRNLKSLKLGFNSIETVPASIGRLRNLETLHLIGNQLRSVPKELGQLTRLTALSAGNRLTYIPEALGELRNLTLLSLWSGDRKAQIPEWLIQLKSITELELVGFDITQIPDWVARWTGLRLLNLSSCQLIDIPDWLGNLQNLTTLLLENNQLTEIPITISTLRELEKLSLVGNRIKVPPPEIANKGIEALREYFRQLEAEGTDHLYEAKLLIVGEGGAGKTTLVKKITDPSYELREEDSTRGIDVVRWHFPLANGRTFQVNIWDFGGQEIYHATHQFFLTKRSLYALVADSRREDTDFYYWLNITELLSDSSPILIVKNEKQDRHREINERALRGRFTNLKETLATNLATCRGLDTVLEEIRHQISHLPHVGTPLPSTWVRVREALEHDPRNYISLEEYLSVCEKHGFAGHKARLQLSEYLHDLGICLHFQDDPLLKKTVILRPKWGTDAVYKVLDNPRMIQNLGHFTRADLDHIWNEPEYAGVQDELLQLMMKFKLCYLVPGAAGSYIAPQLLSVNNPDYSWNEVDNLLLRYTYDFMPKGILTQFIVIMHHFIAKQRLVWKSGVVLSKDQTLAEVKEHYDRREVRIRVAGKHRKELLVIVTHELDKIHASYPRLDYNKLVPCNCSVCKSSPEPHFYGLKVLRRFFEDRQSTIQCQKSYEMVDVLALIDDVVDRDQLMPEEARFRTATAEEPRSQVLIQGSVGQLVMQQTSGGESALHLEERRDDNMATPSKDTVKARSAWANGLFYLLAFVIVIAAVGLLARSVPWYVLPIVLVAGAIFVPLIGALQLRMDERLSQKSFLELMKLVVGQLPLIGRIAKQQNDEESPVRK